jgi:hypothetical protein
MTRQEAIQAAPELVRWAGERHQYYAKTNATATGGTPTYGEKTEVNKNAKNLDIGLHGLEDSANLIPERKAFRDVMNQVLVNLHKAGIPMTMADAQAALWYIEQQLFGKVGAANKASGQNDYLDAAVQLTKKYKQSGLPAQAEGVR